MLITHERKFVFRLTLIYFVLHFLPGGARGGVMMLKIKPDFKQLHSAPVRWQSIT